MTTLDIIPANLWRENKQVVHDLKLLDDSGAEVIVTNESANFLNEMQTHVQNYKVCVAGRSRAASQNTVWLRSDLAYLDHGYRKMCDEVGISPERGATWAGFLLDGIKIATICTHANSHIQEGRNDPHELPRVDELVEHVQNLNQLRKDLLRDYDAVIIAGDLNWSYSGGALAKQWRYAPRRYFARWGMLTNWASVTRPSRGTHGRRAIDYVAFALRAFRVVMQRWVKGEGSDHDWLMVRLRVRKTWARRVRRRRA